MKRIFSFFAVMLLVLTLQAVPAYRGLVSVNQPDGTTLKVYNHGDEFFHYKTTEDGYLVKENAKGVLEYAELSSDNVIKTIGVKARSVAERLTDETKVVAKLQKNVITGEYASLRRQMSAIKRDMASRVAKIGTPNLPARGCVILVNSSDKSHSLSNAQTVFQNMMNETGYSDNGATGSARDYFIASSNNAYQPDFDVIGPYTVSKTASYYGGSDGTANAEYMINEACSLAYADGKSFASYDKDGDKVVDFVYIVYAGYSAADGASGTVWPHSWELSSSSISKANRTYGGYTIDLYACSSELTGTSGTTLDGIGTFCHEFSHVLGLPDYYDTDYDEGTADNTTKTVGAWNIMDYGCYNNSGHTPPTYSAYDRFFMGWMTPTIMKVAENVTLQNIETSNTARVVTASGTQPSSTTTSSMWFFENRQNTGWDAGLPGHGLLVTKVTFNSSAWTGNTVNNGTTMYFDIQEADGATDGSGDAGDTYPGTKSKTTYTPTGSYALTSIAENSGTISFKFMGGISQCTVTFNAGTNGTCATTSLTESASGAGVVLPTAVGKTNYTFAGWSTASSALTADAGVAGSTYHPTANCTLYAVYQNDNEVNLTYTLEGVTKVTGANAGIIAKNQAYTATFTAATCYETLTDASVAVEVLVGSTELTNAYSYNAGTLTVSIPSINVTDNVSVTIFASEKPSVTFGLDDCSTTGAACANKGVSYIATITPNTDYLLSQSDFLITMNGVDLVESTDFTYVGTTLTIPNVTGDLEIIAIATKDPSKVDCSDYSYSFSAKLATGALTLGAYDWNATITNSAYLGYDGTKGAQIGSTANPAQLVSLTTTYTNDCCVSTVIVNASMGSGGDAKLAVYVDGNQVGTTSSLTSSNVAYTFTLTTPTKGNLEVRLTNTVKAVYIKSINVQYGQCQTTDVENLSQSDVMVVSEGDGLRLVNVPVNAQVRIFDMMGRLMLNDNVVEQNEIYQLSSGMYAIQVTTEGRTYILKAICN